MTKRELTLKRRRSTTVPTLLMRAIEEGVQADVLYRRDGTDELRRVSPLELQFDGAGARALCWDHVKRNYRTYRIPQIVGMGLVDQPARPEPSA